MNKEVLERTLAGLDELLDSCDPKTEEGHTKLEFARRDMSGWLEKATEIRNQVRTNLKDAIWLERQCKIRVEKLTNVLYPEGDQWRC